MLMCNNHTNGAITISIITVLLALTIIFVIATSSFFTNDKIDKYTIEKATIKAETVLCMYEEDISKESSNQEQTSQINTTSANTEKSHDANVEKKETKNNTANTKKSTTQPAIVTATSSKVETNTKSEETTVPSQYNGLATIGKIEIPKTGLNMPIYSKVTVKGMDSGPCFLYSTGKINNSGSSLIVGHNYNNIFGKNKNLQIGDKIYVTTLDGNRVAYTVYDKIYVTPDDLSYMSTSNTQIAISTCTNDDNCRLVVLAKI